MKELLITYEDPIEFIIDLDEILKKKIEEKKEEIKIKKDNLELTLDKKENINQKLKI